MISVYMASRVRNGFSDIIFDPPPSSREVTTRRRRVKGSPVGFPMKWIMDDAKAKKPKEEEAIERN
jgi:hypothetical protein